MKIHIIILVYFTLLSQTAIGQNHLEEGRYFAVYSQAAISTYSNTYIYKFEGDTLLENQIYKKMWVTSDSTMQNSWSLINHFFREDNFDKIWQKNLDGSEILLYDFSLGLNDTFDFYHEEFSYPWVVRSIDLIELNNGEIKKRWTFTPFDNESTLYEDNVQYWIEGIGSTRQFYNLCTTSCASDLDYSTLLCLHNESGMIYKSSEYDDCFIQKLLLNTDNPNTDAAIIYPNPTTDIIEIKSRDEVRSLNLYGLDGRLILSLTGETVLDLSNQQPGLYILQVSFANNRSLVKRITKI